MHAERSVRGTLRQVRGINAMVSMTLGVVSNDPTIDTVAAVEFMREIGQGLFVAQSLRTGWELIRCRQ